MIDVIKSWGLPGVYILGFLGLAMLMVIAMATIEVTRLSHPKITVEQECAWQKQMTPFCKGILEKRVKQ